MSDQNEVADVLEHTIKVLRDPSNKDKSDGYAIANLRRQASAVCNQLGEPVPQPKPVSAEDVQRAAEKGFAGT